MPRAARHLAERFKPGIFDRLKQSAEDKKQRGRLKVVAPPPVRVERPTRITNGIFGNTVTFQAPFASTVTCNDPWNQWVGMPMTAQTANSIGAWAQWNGINQVQITTSAATVTWRLWTDTSVTGECWDTWQAPRVRHQNEWGQWVDTPIQRGAFTPRVQVQESEELKRARAEQEARWRAEQEAREKKYQEEQQRIRDANFRAMSLLRSCLTPQQKDSLARFKYFIVVAKSGRRYRIDEGTHGNVKVIDKEGRIVERLCIQPNGVPVGDSMLAQKLLIETAEDVFRQHANITLNDGKVIMGSPALLDGEKLAPVIPIRRAA